MFALHIIQDTEDRNRYKYVILRHRVMSRTINRAVQGANVSVAHNVGSCGYERNSGTSCDG